MKERRKIKNRSKFENPRAVRISTNAQVANSSNIRIVQSVNDHVRWLKNEISTYCHKHILELVANPVNFKRRYSNFSSCYLVAWEVQHVFYDIVDAYLNAFKRRLRNKQFKIQRSIRIERYQRNGRSFKAGDVKSFQLVKRNAAYAGLIKYLCHCSDLSLEALASTKIGEACTNVAQEKPVHWQRIVRLVKQIQATLIGRIRCIVYRNGDYQRNHAESCSYVFRDRSNSKYQWFYRYKTGKGKNAVVVNLPLLTNAKKHDFSKLKLDGNHLVRFSRGKFHVILAQEGERPAIKPQGKVVGGDMNCKNNLIAFSNGLQIRYDEKYLDRLIKQLQALDAKGADRSRNDQRQLEKLLRRNKWYWQHVVHDTLDLLESGGVTDIVLEDLRQFPATFLKHRDLSIKFSRLIRLLRLSNLKNWFAEQALKRGMRVHLTHPHYSSQQCRMCGFIHRKNRRSQEVFSCVECDHKDNADQNASFNLKQRWTSDVLRDKLHDLDEFGRLTPKPMHKHRIRQTLESVPTREDFTVPFASRAVCFMPLSA